MTASRIEVVISSHFTDFGQVKKINSHFTDFKQVKNLIVTLLTLGKSKISLTTKLPWEKLNA